MKVVISGANRGIGLALTQKFLANGHVVVGGCRNPEGARDLWETERDFGASFKMVQLDVTDESDILNLKKLLNGEKIDLLINNAGFFGDARLNLSTVTADLVMKSFKINTIGPMLMCQALIENLLKSNSPKVMHLTSKMGSIADNTSGSTYGYRMSKAALNMFNKSFSIDYPAIASIVAHPGWVQTEMGGSNAPLSIEQSVEGLYELVSKLDRKMTGKFFNYKGDEIPW